MLSLVLVAWFQAVSVGCVPNPQFLHLRKPARSGCWMEQNTGSIPRISNFTRWSIWSWWLTEYQTHFKSLSVKFCLSRTAEVKLGETVVLSLPSISCQLKSQNKSCNCLSCPWYTVSSSFYFLTSFTVEDWVTYSHFRTSYPPCLPPTPKFLGAILASYNCSFWLKIQLSIIASALAPYLILWHCTLCQELTCSSST